LDYKFGLKEESRYLGQVKFYCKTLQQMGYKEVSGYIWYVRLEKLIKC
jgi:hypothetical protein